MKFVLLVTAISLALAAFGYPKSGEAKDELKNLLRRQELLAPGKQRPAPTTKASRPKTGEWCYTGPCGAMDCPSGTRPYCYLDENNACQDCQCESDGVCE
jgi:hypothetical protein